MSWPNVKLAECIESATSGFASGDVDPEGVAQLRMNNVGLDGSLNFEKIRRIPREASKVSRFCLEEGDVLFNATNSSNLVGKTALIRGLSEPFVFSNHFIRIRVIEGKLDAGFLAKWLTAQQQVGRFELMCNKWVNQASVRREDLLKLEMPLPPFAEQRRIAAILDKADALRAKRREAIAKLDQLLQSVFLDMFGDPVTNPKGWVRRELSEICDPSDRVNYGVVQPGDDFAGGVPLVRVGDIEGGHLDASSIKTIDPEIEAAYGRSRLKGSELLVSCVGSIGTIASVPMSAVGYNIARAITRVPLTDPESRSFVRECLRTSGVQRYFAEKTRTVSQPTLNVSFVKSAPVICPPASLVSKFCLLADAVEQKMQSMGSSEVMTAQLFQSLQEQAFSGQLARNG